MRSLVRWVVCLGLVLALATAFASPVGALAPTEERHRVIVEMTDARAVAAVVSTERARGGRVSQVYRRTLQGFAGELSAERISHLHEDPRVLSVVLDQPSEGAGQQIAPPWGLDRIDQRGPVGDGSYAYGSTGAGVTVYVIDTGIRFSHADFGGRARSGYDFVDQDVDASDCHGHGTHVAGIVGGATYGVAKGVELVSLRVWGCNNRGWMSSVVAAYEWILAQPRTPAVINLSGGGAAYEPLDEAVARTTAAGIPTVAAAMNRSSDACLVSPAREPSVITVGATAYDDSRAWFSNFGACVDLFAPGTLVLSSTAETDVASEYESGTSMAAPHVAGAVARYLQEHPLAGVPQVTEALLTAATADVVTDSLSANDGLLYVAPPPLPGPPGDVRAVAGSGSATVSWSAPGSDGGEPITSYTVTAHPAGPVVVVPGSDTSAAVTGLTDGQPYTFTVAAANASGTGPASEPSDAVVPVAPTTVPGVPVEVSASSDAEAGSATLSWAPPDGDGGAPITGYVVARDGSDVAGEGPWSTTVAPETRSVVFGGLVPGSTYRLSVQAVTSAGAGPMATVSVVLGEQPLPDPDVPGEAPGDDVG